MGLRFPRDIRVLEAAVKASDAKLIVIDAGPEHLEEGLKSNSVEDVRRFMGPLNELCERLRVTVLLILHTNKTHGASGTDRIAGSRAWVDAQRHVLIAAKDDEDPDVRHVEVSEKSNIGQGGTGRQFRILTRPVEVRDRDTGLLVQDDIPYIVDEGPSCKSVEELFASKGVKAARDDHDEIILTFLADYGPVLSDDADVAVSELAGIAKSTARDKRMALNKRGLARSTPVADTDTGRRQKWHASITDAGRALIGRVEEEVADW